MDEKEIDKTAETYGLKRNKGETDLNLMWRIGYAQGTKAAYKTSEKALRIGNAILDICDERYEFAKDY